MFIRKKWVNDFAEMAGVKRRLITDYAEIFVTSILPSVWKRSESFFFFRGIGNDLKMCFAIGYEVRASYCGKIRHFRIKIDCDNGKDNKKKTVEKS